ncbi:hypothetical protein QJS66_10250 [Kocuria rhizophila]|nr:hypothetical protein QJS66_10250 [Kocuria rhizophila]
MDRLHAYRSLTTAASWTSGAYKILRQEQIEDFIRRGPHPLRDEWISTAGAKLFAGRAGPPTRATCPRRGPARRTTGWR